MSIYKRGRIWWLNVAGPDGRMTRKTAKTTDRSEALQLEAALRLELQAAAPIFDIAGASRKNTIGFDRLMDEFLEHQAALGRRSYKSFFEVHVRNLRTHFKDIKLEDIDTRAVERYRAQRIRESSVATANRCVAVLRRALNLAIRWNYLDRNPAKGMDPLKEARKIERTLTPDQQSAYLSACLPGFRNFAWLALRTGMRRGELQGLRVRDVDSWRSRVSLPMTKTGSSRHIPVLPKVLKTLEDLAVGKEPEALLLTDVNGRPWTHTMLRRRHKQAVRDARLPWFRFHDLRHTFASDLLASGSPLHVVQRLLGHASVKTTEIYAHLAQEHVHEALREYGSYMSSNITIDSTLDRDLELEGSSPKTRRTKKV
jgi:integrase